MNKILELININKWSEAFDKLSDSSSLFEPIDKINNMFHIACLRNNTTIIQKYIDMSDKSIYNANTEGNTGLHLLISNKNYHMGTKLAKLYPEFLKLQDIQGNLPIHLVDDYDCVFELVNLMLSHNYLHLIDGLFILTILTKIPDLTSPYLNIIKFLNKNKINFNVQDTPHPLLFLIQNKNFELAKYLLTHIPDINVNVKDTTTATSPLILSIGYNQVQLVKLLTENPQIDVNYGGYEKLQIPLNIAINNKQWQIVELLTKCADLNYMSKDKYLNIPVHYLLDILGTKNIVPKSVLEKILTNSDISSANIDRITPYLIMVQYNLVDRCVGYLNKQNLKYIESIKTNQIQNPSIGLGTGSGTGSAMGTGTGISTSKYINLAPVLYSVFNSDILHCILYYIYLQNKYDITVPFLVKSHDKTIWDKTKLDNQLTLNIPTLNLRFGHLISHAFEISDGFFPYLIYWHSKDLYYTHPDITLYLSRALNKTNRFVSMKVSFFIDTNTLHANIVLYDKQTNTLIRFDPYGDWEFIDAFFLDKLINKLFSKCVKTKKVKYLKPGDYIGEANFQLTSNETEILSKNLGDPQGYCLAWCLWYMELKLSNPDVPDKELIKNSIKQIITNANPESKYPLMAHIRAYATMLDNEKNKLLLSYGLTKQELYQVNYSDSTIGLIHKHLKKFCLEQLI